jgi:hypothetical protein
VQLSDDDDFPDDEEILKTTGLINLKKPLTAQVQLKFLVLLNMLIFCLFRNLLLLQFEHHLCLQWHHTNLQWLIQQHILILLVNLKHQ